MRRLFLRGGVVRRGRAVLLTTLGVLLIYTLLSLYVMVVSRTYSYSLTDDFPYNVEPVNVSQDLLLYRKPSFQKYNETSSTELSFPLRDSDIRIHGRPLNKQAFLVIGVPTVVRGHVGTQYLTRTLQSLVRHLAARDRGRVVILVFPGDLQAGKRAAVENTLFKYFAAELNSGLIQMMAVNPESYPPLTGLKRNYNDPDRRVTWRSKQVVDFAFMFWYGSRLGQYYIQIEDDVETVDNFVGRIESFIQAQTKPWALLEFSELGFIGKLYKAADLPGLARFLYLFYQEMPVDFLFRHHMRIMLQDKVILHKPTLFQHFGVYSSLRLTDKQKLNKLKDRYFAGGPLAVQPAGPAKPQPRADTPPAQVFSTMPHYQDHTPEKAYSTREGDYFWGRSVFQNNTFCLVFRDPQRLTALRVYTGLESQKNDYLRHARLEAGTGGGEGCSCVQYETLGVFREGRLELPQLERTLRGPVRCLRLYVTRSQEEWLIIEQFAVHVRR